MTTASPDLSYACIAGEPEIGGARCQKTSVNNLRCPEHQDESLYPQAGSPTNLWLQFNIRIDDIPEEIRETLTIHSRPPTQEREERKINQAEIINRDPYIYGNRMNASGSQVWCGDWVKDISPGRLHAELYDKGYSLWEIVYYSQNSPNRCVVRVKFSTHFDTFTTEYLAQRAWIDSLLSSSWGEGRVFCNPPDRDGIRHIVHFKNQDTDPPSQFFTLKDWNWGITKEAIEA